jgi:hypothetical protein
MYKIFFLQGIFVAYMVFFYIAFVYIVLEAFQKLSMHLIPTYDVEMSFV